MIPDSFLVFSPIHRAVNKLPKLPGCQFTLSCHFANEVGIEVFGPTSMTHVCGNARSLPVKCHVLIYYVVPTFILLEPLLL